MTPLRWTREAPKEAGWVQEARIQITQGIEEANADLRRRGLPDAFGPWDGVIVVTQTARPIAPPEEAT